MFLWCALHERNSICGFDIEFWTPLKRKLDFLILSFLVSLYIDQEGWNIS